MFGDADLPIFFGDFGSPVVFNGVTAKGIFDRPVQIKLADQGYGGVQTALPAVRVPYNAFSPMPTEGSAVTVNGIAYTVAEVTTQGDGAIVCLDLKAAAR